MTTGTKDLLLVAPGVVAGVFFFYLSTLVWGFPLRFEYVGLGDMVNQPTPHEPQYAIDLVFWIIVGVAIFELLAKKLLADSIDESWPWNAKTK
jgi:hypothetical protein